MIYAGSGDADGLYFGDGASSVEILGSLRSFRAHSVFLEGHKFQICELRGLWFPEI